MEPLKQWICDNCGEIIEKPEDGYVIWRCDSKLRIEEMKIIHKVRCDDKSYSWSKSLKDFLGTEGIIEFLSHLDAGKHIAPDGCDIQVADMRNFIETFRRLQIPYYEEARLYWDQAFADGEHVDENETSIYQPRISKSIIEKYRVI